MQPQYNKNWLIYESLWQKYGEKKEVCIAKIQTPKLSSQEDSVKWSIKLKKVFQTLAKEIGASEELVRNYFIEGSISFRKKDYPEVTRTQWGLAFVETLRTKGNTPLVMVGPSCLKAAKETVERYELFFDFDSPEELFLLEESDESSVILF